jgi:GTP cyclohydrolase FolE2
MSLCPSSKAIADYGAHNQRSHITIAVRPRRGARCRWPDLVRVGEEKPRASSTGCSNAATRNTSPSAPTSSRASSRTWSVASRALLTDTRLAEFRVSAENFESIHNHSAYAEIVRGSI